MSIIMIIVVSCTIAGVIGYAPGIGIISHWKGSVNKPIVLSG